MSNPSRVQVLRSRRRRLLLDAEPAAPSFVATHQLTVDATIFAGRYWGKYVSGAAGAIDPTTFEGDAIGYCLTDAVTDDVFVSRDAGGKFNNGTDIDTINMTIEGEDPIALAWTGTWYELTDTNYSDLIAAAAGTDLPIKLEAA